ncbi:MAG: UDP-N-acetylmuramate dehydrogenase [Flavobacteriaceae bacterium]|nr:UDP-N-acetylmuramate dehydrogenase [Flavobacteriaceae bacterium]
MDVKQNYSLKKYNSFNIDVVAKEFIQINSVKELIDLQKNSKNKNKLFIGGGSNILFTNNFEGLVVHINLKGISVKKMNENFSEIKVMSGENWNELVNWCIENNLGGLENLSLIPGNVGAAPIQNIGAYGVELKDVFISCEVYDLNAEKLNIYNLNDCKFGYRDSIFKKNKNLIVVSVKMKLSSKNHKINSSYGGINDELKKLNIKEPTIKDISNVVCDIRNKKLPNPNKIGNAGSFFKNPIVNSKKINWLKENFNNIPFYKIDENSYKIPAAWLIETSGFKGKDFGNFGVHKTQPLVLVNYGKASGSDINKLSLSIKEVVNKLFKIELETEVNII